MLIQSSFTWFTIAFMLSQTIDRPTRECWPNVFPTTFNRSTCVCEKPNWIEQHRRLVWLRNANVGK